MKKIILLLLVILSFGITKAQPPCPITAAFNLSQNGPTIIANNTSTSPYTYSLWATSDGATASMTNVFQHTFTTNGTYLVCLTIVYLDSLTGTNCQDSTCQLVTVTNASQTCSASFTSTTQNLTASFNNTSTGGAMCYWNYGDGNTAFSCNPAPHTYSAPGTYTVCLVLLNSSQQFCDSTCQQIVVNGTAPCSASFNSTTSNLTASFINTSTNSFGCYWNFGDGNVSNLCNPLPHTYTSAGTYTVCLVLLDSNQMVCDSTCHQVTVNGSSSGCTASFTSTTQNLTTSFNNTSTGGAMCYWNFGDGNSAFSCNPVPHTYSAPGTYTVCLVLLNSSQQFCDSSCQQITVSGSPACSANFSSTTSNLTAAFLNTSTNSFGCYWNFGDGNVSNLCNPLPHTYANAGTYTVCLVLLDSNQTVCDSTCHQVVVNGTSSGCNADFTYNTQQLTTNFVNTSSGASAMCYWSFGDGQFSNLCNPTPHTYAAPGTYTVCLILLNSSQQVCDSTCHQITVNNQASCTASFTFGTQNLVASFVNTSSTSQSCNWNFGDNTTYTGCTPPVHNYANSGTYVVCLTIADSGCTASFCDTVTVQNVGIQNVAKDKYNYVIAPNPATSKCSIKYALMKESRVGLKVYDIIGNVVYELPTHTEHANSNTVDISLHGLNKGIYFIDLKINDTSNYKKLIIE